MQDPVVRYLTYRMRLPENHRISDEAPPWSGRLGNFDAELSHNVLTLLPRSDHLDVESARAAVEPLLHAWEAAEDIDHALPLSFEFESASVEDRAASPGSHMLAAAGAVAAAGRLSIVVSQSVNPSPPSPTFRSTALVERLRARWRAAREGRRPLLTEANYVFTDLISEFGSGDWPAAAKALNVAQPVLRALSSLSARQHPTEARKVDLTEPDLDPRELEWIRAVVPILLMRAGEEGAGKLPQITMDYPGIPRLNRPWHRQKERRKDHR